MITDNDYYNKKYIDLHTHSTASDGSMTPSELVRHAFESGLAAVALTDHDTVAGVEQALDEGARIGIEVIAGVEISVSLSSWDIPVYKCPHEQNWNHPLHYDRDGNTSDLTQLNENSTLEITSPNENSTPKITSPNAVSTHDNKLYAHEMSEPEMHLLGYFFSGECKPLHKTLEELREKRDQRNPRIIGKLNEMGFDITMEEVAEKAAGGITGRPHIARVLMEKGYILSIAEGFDKYLAAGRPAYFKKDKLTPEEGIAEILRSGGIPVLAHPIYLGLRGAQLDRVLGKLKAAGLKGIEALYTGNTPDQTDELLRLAAKHGLRVTGGSDFHGSFKPDIEIGTGRGDLRVPYSLLECLRNE